MSGQAQRQLNSLPMAVLLLSPGQTIAMANPAAEQLFGQSARRLNARPLSELITFDEPLLAERLGDCDAQISARSTGVALAGQGSRLIDVMAAPMLDSPGWQVLTLHDIGSAEAMRANPSMSDNRLVRAPDVLAHEIKNPLAGIRGAAQLLGRKVGEKDRALTSLIADEVDRIAKLIDQMQSLSTRTAPELGPCNLHEAIRRAGAVIAASGKAPPISEQFDPSLPSVRGNADALLQVLINLIANAADACREVPKPEIIVRTRFASGLQLHVGADGSTVRLPIELRVSDNGPGVDPAMRNHLFEPFTTTKKSGQGLGLALVSRLVRDMNGQVAHERDEKAGQTHFRVHLAVAAAAPKAAQGRAA